MTDLVPYSLAQTLDAIRADLAELHRAIERVTISPAPEWVRVSDAARIEGVSASTIRREVQRGERECNGKRGAARRVRVESFQPPRQ